jgi:hypothetical protein
MRTLTKGLAAGAVGLAVLVPAGIAVAADDGDAPPTPACTVDQRQDHLEAHDRLRAEILDQLREEGVTDPDEVRDQLRDRLHDAMEEEHPDMPGPRAGVGPAHGAEHPGGPRDGDCPLTG